MGRMDKGEVRSPYGELLACWNRRQAGDFAAQFTQMNGQPEIEVSLRQIFADPPTAAYVGKIRQVRFLTPEVAILCAVAGMVSPGQSDLNPAVNAVQTLVATARGGRWRIEVFQNTPAAFHGRADLREQLTEELRQVFRSGGTA